MKIEDLKIPRRSHCVSVLGKYLYIVGGISQGGEILSDVEKYDEDTNSWKKVVPMNYPKMNFGLVSLKTKENKLLTIGGHPKIEYYTRKNNAWKFHEYNINNNGCSYFAIASCKNKIYTSGGKCSDGTLDRVFQYDPVEIVWKGLPKMNLALSNHCMVELDNKLYVIGGVNEEGKTVNVFHMLDLSNLSNGWTELLGLRTSRMNHSAVVFKNFICVMGGENRTGELEDIVEIYNPENNTWFISRKLPYKLPQFASIVYNDKIYITGGLKEDNSFSGEVFIYEPIYREENKKDEKYKTEHKEHKPEKRKSPKKYSRKYSKKPTKNRETENSIEHGSKEPSVKDILRDKRIKKPSKKTPSRRPRISR
jgi:N-acetylneuraminic acid mutarotase